MIACANGDRDIAEYLLERGAKITNRAALILAAARGGPEVLKLFDDFNAVCSNNGVTPLLVAADNGNVETVEFLLEQGVDPNHVDRKGNSPLLVAASRGFLDCVNLLCKAGADVHL